MSSVTVELSRRDLARLSAFALWKSTVARWILIALGVFVIGNLLTTRGTLGTLIGAIAILLTTLVFVGGAAVLMLLLNWAAIALASRESNGVLGRHVYSVRDDGLLEVTSANETLIKWGGATALYRAHALFYIQVAPGLFHIFPRRCFESQESFEFFWKSIQGLVPNKSLERTREV